MKFKLKEKAKEAKELAKTLPLEEEIIDFLIHKGYKTPEEISYFLNFNEKTLRSVKDMKDGKAFIKRIVKAVKDKEKICIYGDYDGDGVCATSIFVWFFRWLGIEVNWFISNRFKEGYGLSVKGMTRLLETYPDTQLVITCDNGIVAFDGIEYAKSKGVDVIISDHHEASPDGRLPDCLVVCEKRLDEDKSSFEDFCGAELARRIVVETAEELHKEEELKELLPLLYSFSGFATVTDIIPLNAANHYVVKKGLQIIKDQIITNSESGKVVFPCWSALASVYSIKVIDEGTIGFKFGPTVNAAGRVLGEATLPMHLMLSSTQEEANTNASNLLGINEVRQKKSDEQQKNAKKEIEAKQIKNDNFIIVGGPTSEKYEEGIAGLIATFIVNSYEKPAICLGPTETPGIYKGSARSVKGFNLKKALDKCSELLVGYGGHPMAAGLTIKGENIEELRKRLNNLATEKESTEEDEIINVDYLIRPGESSIKLTTEYNSILSPFGPGFEKPCFAVMGKLSDSVQYMKERHIKSLITGYGYNEESEVLWFNARTKFEELNPLGRKVVILGTPGIDSFNGNITATFITDKMFVIKEKGTI